MGEMVWNLVGWSPVMATPAQLAACIDSLMPSGEPPTIRESTGQTLWTGSLNGMPFGIGWEWFELCPGVLALADPMMVMTNLFLIDEEGRVLSEDRRVLCLNSVIHGLAWQQQVLAGSSTRFDGVNPHFRSPVLVRRRAAAEPALMR